MPNDPIDLSLSPATPTDAGESPDYGSTGQVVDFDVFGTDAVQPQTGILYSWGANVAYDHVSGLVASPVAASPQNAPPVAFWRSHAPYDVKTVTWVAQMIGALPPMPSSDTGTPNEVLMWKRIVLLAPDITPDGQSIYGLMGTYFYCLQVPLNDSDPILVPNHPLISQQTIAVTPSTFSDQLIGPVQAPSGFQGGAINF